MGQYGEVSEERGGFSITSSSPNTPPLPPSLPPQLIKIKTFESGGRTQALVEYKDASVATNALVLSHNSLLVGRNIWVAYSKNRVMAPSSPEGENTGEEG